MSLTADLEKLKNNPSTDLKRKIVEKIASCYTQKIFKEEEKALAIEILSVIAYDQDIKLRAILSESLKNCDFIPKGLALKLANDVNEVSVPMLECSSLLSEEDLFKIIQTLECTECLSAIARRKSLQENISLEIISKKKSQPTLTLINNKTAHLNEECMQKIIDYHNNEEDLIATLVNRGNLPLKIFEKAIKYVSSNLRQELCTKYQIDPNKIDNLIKKVEQDAIAGQANKVDDSKILIKFIDNINKKGELTPSFVFKSLCRGYLKFFVASLAIFSKISYKYAHKMTFEGSKGTFGNLYSKCNMPNGTFESVYIVFKAIQDFESKKDNKNYSSKFANNILEAIMSLPYNIDSIPNLKYFMALISSQDKQADELFQKLEKQIEEEQSEL